MSFWEFLWLVFKVGLWVTIGIPLILFCICVLILIFI